MSKYTIAIPHLLYEKAQRLTRELVITRYPYIIVYEMQADSVHILPILHASQQWPSR